MIVSKLIVPLLFFIQLAFSYGQESKIKVEYHSPLPIIPPGLRISTFDLDATPPLGSQLAYDTELNDWDLGLRAKGVVILGSGQPIVICAVDWLYISNAAHETFRSALAEAAGTVPERVAVHTVHQHDALICDFSSENILLNARTDPGCYEGTYARQLIRDLAVRVRKSLESTQPVTHLGTGTAKVEQVASNRRITGKDGKVRATRWTATPDSALRAEHEGVIDPMVSLVSLWNNDKPLVVLSYYATHPQSYYRTGIANPDFPGVARFLRQLEVPDALHVHFNGAGGNLGAGKYNDGTHINRYLLAERLADGMKRAWEATRREPLTAGSVKWSMESVDLPLAEHIEKLKTRMLVVKDTIIDRNLAPKLAWIRRNETGQKIYLTCLTLGSARIIHLPGELFIEYQLAAKAMRNDLFVAVAAYGDCGPGYIGTFAAYDQGGYETGQVSFVGPGSEEILMTAIQRLLAGSTAK